jgi:hypothetical protein
VEDAPGAREVYGLGPEDRWPHEMDQDGSITIRRHSSGIGRDEYLGSRIWKRLQVDWPVRRRGSDWGKRGRH